MSDPNPSVSQPTPAGAPVSGLAAVPPGYAYRPGPPGYHWGLHAVAFLTACATFVLLIMGGLVTSHQAGMAVPDWPTTFDQNMFLFPPRLWVGGVFYEHTHRLMGTVIGTLAIILACWTVIVDGRRWVRWLSVWVLLAVIAQGVLGGLRVVRSNLDLAIVHGCLAHAFFCLTALMAIVTSRWWFQAPDLSRSDQASAGRWLLGIAAFTVTAIYLQLIAGAVMRHHGAGLAIPDFPLSYGHLLPPMDAAQLAQANALRAAEGLPPVRLTQVHIHFVHRIGALVVLIGTILLGSLVLSANHVHRQHGALRRPARLLAALVIVQVALGVLTVLLRKPTDVTTAHVAVGALALVAGLTLFVRGLRLYGPGGCATADQPASPAGSGTPRNGWSEVT